MKTGDVFAFVSFKLCGCFGSATTSRGLVDHAQECDEFREQIEAGTVRAVMTREEFMAIPWKCDKCKVSMTSH